MLIIKKGRWEDRGFDFRISIAVGSYYCGGE